MLLEHVACVGQSEVGEEGAVEQDIGELSGLHDFRRLRDTVGPPAYNLRLSDKRVRAAREFLIYRGIAPERISSRGFGEQNPRASNASGQGRAQNRRIEFKVEEQRSEEGGQIPAADDISLISLGDATP